MSPRILELLAVFRVRSMDEALRGRMCLTQEAFHLAANELDLAIKESPKELPVDRSVIGCIPVECIQLVHEALNFDHDCEDCWERLGQAAMAIQSGPS